MIEATTEAYRAGYEAGRINLALELRHMVVPISRLDPNTDTLTAMHTLKDVLLSIVRLLKRELT